MVAQTGMLQNETMEISAAALREFISATAQYGAKQVKAVATSALREARNADIFLKRVSDETGMEIEVISGEAEARLNLKGILIALPEDIVQPQHSTLIIDMGGGSSEWILYGNQKVLAMESIPVGVITLAQACIKTDPISRDNMQAMDRKIVTALRDMEKSLGRHIDRNRRLIGTGGTFTTIASLDIGLKHYSREQVHLHTVSLKRLEDLRAMLVILPLEERKQLSGLEPERADLIIPGIHFTISIMKMCGLEQLTVSDYGLLEGVLLTVRESGGKGI